MTDHIVKIEIDNTSDEPIEIPEDVRMLCSAFALGLKELGYRHVMVLLKKLENDQYQQLGVNATIPHELVPASLEIALHVTTSTTPELHKSDRPS